jgi:flagellar biosynthetic protein FliQ
VVFADRFFDEGTHASMTPGQVVELLRDALMAAFWMALPLLAVGFVAGIVMSLVQVLTSIQDTAFGTVPRLLVSLGSILLLLPWLVHRSMAYTTDLITNLGRYGH